MTVDHLNRETHSAGLSFISYSAVRYAARHGLLSPAGLKVRFLTHIHSYTNVPDMPSPVDLKHSPSSLTAGLPPLRLRSAIPGISNALECIAHHLHTAILFTWTDYKTIFFPIVR